MHFFPSPSPLLTIPQEILVGIAVETALVDPLGPPVHLVPLLCTCKSIYSSLSRYGDLYARIFRAKFDITAPRRRLGSRAVINRNLTVQLKKQCLALKRIRNGDIYSHTVEDDIVTAYIMMIENDGKNAVQVKEWANGGEFVDRFVRERLWENRSEAGWPLDNTVNSFALWFLWMTSEHDKIRAEPVEKREELISLVYPYVVGCFRFMAFHLPDIHYEPTRQEVEDVEHSVMTAHGPYPHYPSGGPIQICHYNTTVELAKPILSTAAGLIYFSRREITGFTPSVGTPLNREQADALGTFGPTVVDYQEVNSHPHVRLPDYSSWDWRAKFTTEQLEEEDSGWLKKGLKAPSAAYDNDWCRLYSCWDPPRTLPYLPKYSNGTFTGSWMGRMLGPVEEDYMAMIPNPEMPPTLSEYSPFMIARPLMFEINEHLCISPETPFPSNASQNGHDDGIRTAWFQSQLMVTEDGSGVRFTNRSSGRVHHYRKYIRGASNFHNEDKCTICNGPDVSDVDTPSEGRTESESSESGLEDTEDPGPSHASEGQTQLVEDAFESADMGRHDDIDDEYEEFYEGGPCDGIEDTAFTGRTERRHGDAWGHYRFFGRLRKFDGLIALVRVPVGQPDASLRTWGTFIFRGYIYSGQIFTGRWRLFPYGTRTPPYEGAFIASKVQPRT